MASSSTPPLSALCEQSQATIAQALARAPGRVVLHDGTTLSQCARNASDDADFETVGSIFVAVADTLARSVPRSNAAALQLGYLVGAVQKGTAASDGVDYELVHRLQNAAGPGGPPADRSASYQQGLAAGARDG